MNTRIRAAALVCAVCSSLAFAGSAFASFAPKLVVSSGSGGATRIGVSVGLSDDPTARATFYIPSAYRVGVPAAGTKLGAVTASASAAILAGALLPLTGNLVAIAPTAATNATAVECQVKPTQTWELDLSALGQSLDIPVFVAQSALPGYSSELVVCLPPPQTAFQGAKLLSATFSSSAITAPATAGEYRWTSLWTPYVSGGTTANAAGSVEVQGLQRIPTALKLNVTKTKITVTRKLNGKKQQDRADAREVLVDGDEQAPEPRRAPSSSRRPGGKRGRRRDRLVHARERRSPPRYARPPSSTATRARSRPARPRSRLVDLYFHDLGASACTPSADFGGLPCVGRDRRRHAHLSATTTVTGSVARSARGASFVSWRGGRGADRDVLLGGRRPVEALVPAGHAAEGAPRLLRRALLDRRGRLDLLPRPDRADGARLGRADAGRLRDARQGVRADDAASRSSSNRCRPTCARACPSTRAAGSTGRRPSARGAVFREFLDALAPLREAGKLGGILFQMPPYVVWKPSSLDYLEWAREQVGGDAFLFEPRHRSWYAEDIRAELLRFLEERTMTWVVVDAPKVDAAQRPGDARRDDDAARLRPLPRQERRHLERARRRRPRSASTTSTTRTSCASGCSRCASCRTPPRRSTPSSTTTTRRTASPRRRPARSCCASCSKRRRSRPPDARARRHPRAARAARALRAT